MVEINNQRKAASEPTRRYEAYPGSFALVFDSDRSFGSPNFVLLRKVY